jgi:acyl-CoA reductase-like NAD-dependent aldehyde dehydrogenase
VDGAQSLVVCAQPRYEFGCADTEPIEGERASGRGGEGGLAENVLDPSVNEVLFRVTPASIEEVDAAVKSGWRAFRGPWAKMPGREEGACITRSADLMRQNVDTLAELESRNTGIPITQSRFEVESAARHLEYFAGFAGKIEGMSAALRGWLVSDSRASPAWPGARLGTPTDPLP